MSATRIAGFFFTSPIICVFCCHIDEFPHRIGRVSRETIARSKSIRFPFSQASYMDKCATSTYCPRPRMHIHAWAFSYICVYLPKPYLPAYYWRFPIAEILCMFHTLEYISHVRNFPIKSSPPSHLETMLMPCWLYYITDDDNDNYNIIIHSTSLHAHICDVHRLQWLIMDFLLIVTSYVLLITGNIAWYICIYDIYSI